MTAQSTAQSRFVRRTQLSSDEYHKNFHKLDRDVIAAVSSVEADVVTPLMSKIYLRLVNAPLEYWEREGVLRFSGEERKGEWATAWEQLVSLLGVASGTARKALMWMNEQGILGYFAGKNGVGIRIFINRASSSIGRKASENQKNLRLVHTSSGVSPASNHDMPFKDSFAVLEILDTDINSRAPKTGADKDEIGKIPSQTRQTTSNTLPVPNSQAAQTPTRPKVSDVISVEEIVLRLKLELEPSMRMAAQRAANHEHQRTREWLENRGLPKAARVAQHETYKVLRKYGLISESARGTHSQADVDRSGYIPPEPHTLSANEISDLAEACVAMLETKGQSIDLTLSEMSVESEGFLLADDAVKVREKANNLLAASDREEKRADSSMSVNSTARRAVAIPKTEDINYLERGASSTTSEPGGHVMTYRDSAVYKEYYGPGRQRGLAVQTES